MKFHSNIELLSTAYNDELWQRKQLRVKKLLQKKPQPVRLQRQNLQRRLRNQPQNRLKRPYKKIYPKKDNFD